ncbi:MAG: squalene/phytoene synthase family protein, partial [Candidatus Devosia euplotis]|nr:squalene/phytoene synthase family protein [Candidatus Devosia euplotis]
PGERVPDRRPVKWPLHWWGDALVGGGPGAGGKTPVADALLAPFAHTPIPAGTLLRLIGARRFDLYDDPMPDLESFEGYAGETVSALYQLAAMILNDGQIIEAGDAAGHLGVAHAMVGHLRAFGHFAAQGRIMLPWTIFAANGVREGDIFSGTESEALSEALGQISELAADHLAMAEIAIAQLPGHLKPAFAPVAVLKIQLKRLRDRPHGLFVPVPDQVDWRKIAGLAWWGFRNR